MIQESLIHFDNYFPILFFIMNFTTALSPDTIVSQFCFFIVFAPIEENSIYRSGCGCGMVWRVSMTWYSAIRSKLKQCPIRVMHVIGLAIGFLICHTIPAILQNIKIRYHTDNNPWTFAFPFFFFMFMTFYSLFVLIYRTTLIPDLAKCIHPTPLSPVSLYQYQCVPAT